MISAGASRRFRCIAHAAIAGAFAVTACGDDDPPGVNNIVPGPAAITIDPSAITFDAIGATQGVTATVRDRDGNILPDAPVTWSTTSNALSLAQPTVVGHPSLAADLAAQNVTGQSAIVIAEGAGTGTVVARSGSVTQQLQVTVQQVAAQLLVLTGDRQTGTVGTALAEELEVRLLDRLGNPIAGRTITFAPSQGAGSVAPATATTNAEGEASVIWTLGTIPGEHQLAVSVGGLSSAARFTATALAGPAARIELVSAGSGTAPAGTAVPTSPTVRVTDQFGNALPGVTVSFAVTAGGGSLANTTVVTDQNGIATVPVWTLGPAIGVNTITASVVGVPATLAISVTGSGGPAFSITLRLLSSMTAAQEAAFASAAARWSSIIVGDLPDVPVSITAGRCGTNSPALSETIDDVLIFATIAPIDGRGRVLGFAGPCYVRNGTGGLTIIGEMVFDIDDVNAMQTSSFTSVVLHEMGHVLGVGTYWPDFGLQNPSQTAGPPRDTFFPGVNAVAGFDAIGGLAYTGGQKVPVENTGSEGTINAHWRESILLNELMTGFLNAGVNPLSVLTVRSLQDLGYVVNPAAADPFTLTTAALRVAEDPIPIAVMNDVRRGTIYRVDPAGRVVGTGANRRE